DAIPHVYRSSVLIYLLCLFGIVELSPRFPLFPYTTLFRSWNFNEELPALIAKTCCIDFRSFIVFGCQNRQQTRYSLGREYLPGRSEEHTSELQSRFDLVCRLLLEKKNQVYVTSIYYSIDVS